MKLHLLNNCKHYGNVRGNPTCDRQVDVRAHVGGDDFGWLRRLPCVKSSFQRDVIPCSLAEFPTREEIVESRGELDRFLATMDAGICPDCGKALMRQENDQVSFVSCPDGHVSMRGCKKIGAYP